MIGIANASRLSVADAVSPTPNMRSTVLGWLRPIELVRVTSKIVDHQAQESLVRVEANGIVQPFTDEQLLIKPEGERSWKWWMIHATPDLVLKTDEIITYKGTRLRIMMLHPYEANGYVQYDAIEDYNANL